MAETLRKVLTKNTITITYYEQHQVSIDLADFANRREHWLESSQNRMTLLLEALNSIKKQGRGGISVSVIPVREYQE